MLLKNLLALAATLARWSLATSASAALTCLVGAPMARSGEHRPGPAAAPRRRAAPTPPPRPKPPLAPPRGRPPRFSAPRVARILPKWHSRRSCAAARVSYGRPAVPKTQPRAGLARPSTSGVVLGVAAKAKGQTRGKLRAWKGYLLIEDSRRCRPGG